MAILRHNELLDLHRATVHCGLAEWRRELLCGLSPQIASSLSNFAEPANQILSDLATLNEIDTLQDGSCPLTIWLQTALAIIPWQHDPRPFSTILIALHERGRGLLDAPLADEPTIALADTIYGSWLVELRTRHRRRPLLRVSIEPHGRISTRIPTKSPEEPPGGGAWQLVNANELILRLSGVVTSNFSVRVRFVTVSKSYLDGRSRTGETLLFMRISSLGTT